MTGFPTVLRERQQTAPNKARPENEMEKSAKLYRIVTGDHVCPYGLKSKHLLEKEGSPCS